MQQQIKRKIEYDHRRNEATDAPRKRAVRSRSKDHDGDGHGREPYQICHIVHANMQLFQKDQIYHEDAFKDAGDIFNIIPGNNFDSPMATTYRIYDAWQGMFSGVVEVTRELSKYRFDG